MTRPSWYRCDVCQQPHTDESPLVRAEVEGNPRAAWQIHDECAAALRESLKDGVRLCVRPA